MVNLYETLNSSGFLNPCKPSQLIEFERKDGAMMQVHSIPNINRGFFEGVSFYDDAVFLSVSFDQPNGTQLTTTRLIMVSEQTKEAVLLAESFRAGDVQINYHHKKTVPQHITMLCAATKVLAKWIDTSGYQLVA